MDTLGLTAAAAVSPGRSPRRPLPRAIAGAVLVTVGVFAALAVHPVVCLGLAVAGLVAVRAELSRVVLVYVVVVAACIVVAPRLLPGPNPTVAHATVTVAGLPDTYAALWISVAAFAGTTTSRWRVLIARTRRHDRCWDAPVPAVLAVSAVALAVQVALLASAKIGVPAQLDGGSSGGGYFGLFATVGALLAAGCLVKVWSEGRLRSGIGWCAAVLVGGHVGATMFTGFRSAAPLLCVTLVLTALGNGRDHGERTTRSGQTRPGQRNGPGRTRPERSKGLSKRRSKAMPLVVLGAVGLAVVPLYLAGVNLREKQAVGKYSWNHGLSLWEATLARTDHRPYLVRAIERRHDPEARAAVALRDQATAIVPRFLYPDKPTVDYHQRVSRVFFYSNSDNYTASPLTPFGDGLVNVGVFGTVIIIGAYVLVLDGVFRRFARRAAVGGFAIQVSIVENAFDIGSPVLLDAVNMVRTGVMVLATLGLARVAAFGASRLATAVAAQRPSSLVPRQSPPRPAAPRQPVAVPKQGRHRAEPPHGKVQRETRSHDEPAGQGR